jgi:hypothetical protein
VDEKLYSPDHVVINLHLFLIIILGHVHSETVHVELELSKRLWFNTDRIPSLRPLSHEHEKETPHHELDSDLRPQHSLLTISSTTRCNPRDMTAVES